MRPGAELERDVIVIAANSHRLISGKFLAAKEPGVLDQHLGFTREPKPRLPQELPTVGRCDYAVDAELDAIEGVPHAANVGRFIGIAQSVEQLAHRIPPLGRVRPHQFQIRLAKFPLRVADITGVNSSWLVD